ncbi:TlpA family protein disulfide reductase [Eudoraea sp.]|uniref:TlpA family protein disulfide reductase n=1 Tax=Eudoraea sp. TaxID=1979955 RepID=UPI003C7152A5
MNISIKFLLFLICIFLLTSCFENSNTASVIINSTGQHNDSVWVQLYPYDKPESSFLKLKLNNGFISFDTLITTPHFGIIMFPTKLDNGKLEYIFSEHIEFLLKPKEKIQIKASFEKDRVDYSIKENSFNNELKEYNLEIANETRRIQEIYREIYNNFPNEYNWTLPGIDSLLKQRKPYQKIISDKKEIFIKANLNNEIAAYLMYYYPKEKVQELSPLLSDGAKNSTYGKFLEKKLAFWASLDNGSIAPNFNYKTIDDKQLSLDQLKGKYVLLDFWGAWCPPCREDIPELKIFYDTNKNSVEIVSIACHDKYDIWKNLVLEKEMDWIQIFNNPENEDLTKTYDINVFPSKILIDPSGKIIQTIKGEGRETFVQLNKLITTANNGSYEKP